MPTISRFFGILIQMYLDDHPPPHFHAIYGEFDAHSWGLAPAPADGRRQPPAPQGRCLSPAYPEPLIEHAMAHLPQLSEKIA